MIKDFFKIHSYNYKQSDKNLFNLKIFKIDDYHKRNSNLYKNIAFFKQKKKNLKKLKIYFFYHREYSKSSI